MTAEVAKEDGIPKKRMQPKLWTLSKILYAFYESAYTNGGDTFYMMEQISDKRNKENLGRASFPERGHDWYISASGLAVGKMLREW